MIDVILMLHECNHNSRVTLSLLARWRCWWRCWTGRLINLARWRLERDFDNNGQITIGSAPAGSVVMD